MFDNTPNQPSKLKTKNWGKRNDESRGTYHRDNQIRFKTSLLRSSLCDYSDPYIPVKRTVTVSDTAFTDANANNTCATVIFESFVPFINCIGRINNT